jgi:aminodeoxyfutalosine synthase
VRTRLHGKRTYYVRNYHLNYTNICINSCRFCAFSKKEDDGQAYAKELLEISDNLASNLTPGVREIHIVGGCHPNYPFEYYKEMLSNIRVKYPHLTIKAFSAVEIAHFADNVSNTSDEEVLKALKESGLDCLPGGGAEQLAPNIRTQLCPEKIDGTRWLDIHRTAHTLGIKTNATMLYGHIENAEDRVYHLQKLRGLQDNTSGFMSFIPLPFHPANTQIKDLGSTLALDDLKNIAIARLFLDNFPHIKAYWIPLGAKLAQVALHFGANDLDGTILQEQIYHSAGAQTPEGLTAKELTGLIKEAGFEPVERDGKYCEAQVAYG